MRSLSLLRTVLLALGLSFLISIAAAADVTEPASLPLVAAAETTPGPEPSSLIMFGTALVGLAMLSRLSRYVPISGGQSEAIQCQIISVNARRSRGALR